MMQRISSAIWCCVLALGALAATADEPVQYTVENYAIPRALSAEPGDPTRGARVVAEHEPGNCLSCHAVPVDAAFFGTTGPSLAGVARRLNAGQLRLRLADPKQINPLSIMPAYYRTQGLQRVAPAYAGQTILTAQQIEDVVAFLLTLD